MCDESRLIVVDTETFNPGFFQLVQEGALQYQQFTLKSTVYTIIRAQPSTIVDFFVFRIWLTYYGQSNIDIYLKKAAVDPMLLYTVYDVSSKYAGNINHIPRNLKFVYATQNQASALAGYYVALMQNYYAPVFGSQTGLIPGAASIPAVQDFILGYTFGYTFAGLGSAIPPTNKSNADVTVSENTTFIDNTVSYAITNTLLTTNPDIKVIFTINGNAYLGSLNAVQDQSAYAIGVDDQTYDYVYSFNPTLASVLMGTVLKYMNLLIFRYLLTNPSVTGTPTDSVYTLKDGVVDFQISSPFADLASTILPNLAAFRTAIENGTIIVPSVMV